MRLAAFDFIECFYNPHQRHSPIGGVPPVAFETLNNETKNTPPALSKKAKRAHPRWVGLQKLDTFSILLSLGVKEPSSRNGNTAQTVLRSPLLTHDDLLRIGPAEGFELRQQLLDNAAALNTRQTKIQTLMPKRQPFVINPETM